MRLVGDGNFTSPHLQHRLPQESRCKLKFHVPLTSMPLVTLTVDFYSNARSGL